MSAEILWEEINNKKTIELTVALPALNSKKIIWIALESLKNQIDINFGWELIIWEEFGESIDIIKSFYGLLPNCQKIKYRNIPAKIPLMHKWVGIAKDCDPQSTVYVMQAADCYSPKKRLKIHYEHFKNPLCMFSTQDTGLFYNLLTSQQIIYHYPQRFINLNMAYKVDDFKKVPTCSLRSGIDTYIRENIDKIRKGVVLRAKQIDPDSWKYGIDTDGANNISIARRRFYNNINKPFVSLEYGQKNLGYTKMEDYIPKNVQEFLINYNKSE